MSTPIVEIKDLHLSFATWEGTARVVDGVDLLVGQHESVSVVGETGCGKSVIAKAVAGVLPVPPAKIEKGEIYLKGKDILSMSRKEADRVRRKEVSMVFQDPMNALNPVYTVGDHLVDSLLWKGDGTFRFTTYVAKKRNKAAVKKAWKDSVQMLESVRVPSPERIMKRYPIELSGGMRQRVLIAMALLGKPSLLIADEPTTSVDVSIEAQILDLISDMIKREDVAVMYITHDLAVAKQISNRVYVLYAGTVAEKADSNVLFRNPVHPYTTGLMASIPKLDGTIGEGIREMLPDYTAPPSGCRFHPRCDKIVSVCSQERPDLVEVEPGHWVACHLAHGA